MTFHFHPIQFIHAKFISRFYHVYRQGLSAEKGAMGREGKTQRRHLEDTIGGEKTSQTARLARGGGEEEGKKLQVGGSWWTEKAWRGRRGGGGEHGARKIGPAKISLISLSEIAAKCNASPVDERRAHRRPAPSPSSLPLIGGGCRN